MAPFSKESLKDDIPARLSGLPQVDLYQDDQLSPYVCRERLLSASTTCSLQQVSRCPVCHKRVKDTSGIGVSPTYLDHSQEWLFTQV